MKTIDFYADAGHGWAEVHISELKRLGIISKISSYSYQKGEFVYLEEDCDLFTYCKALEQQGESFEFNDIWHGDNSKIRSYASFSEIRS